MLIMSGKNYNFVSPSLAYNLYVTINKYNTMKTYVKPYNSLLWGVVAIIIGILLIFNPESAISTTVILLGALVLSVGVVQMLVYLVQSRKMEQGRWSGMPFGSVVMIIWGGIMLARPDFWADFVMILIGVSFIFLAINQISMFIRVRRQGAQVGFSYYIFPILMLLSGIVTIWEPLFLASWLVIFVGFWIIAYGLVEVVNYFALKGTSK